MAQSGDVFEASRFARLCEVSRGTISNYLSVLETTFVVHVIRPFSSHRATEIVAAPKVYGFDTGFVCYYRRWSELRQDDLGTLWEHFVLNEVMAHTQSRDIRYWRNKRDQEVDFVLTHARALPVAIECKWSASGFSPRPLLAFRRQYPDGENFVVAHDVDRSFTNTYNGIQVKFVNLDTLIAEIYPSKR